MNKLFLFKRLIISDIKRLKKYMPRVLISVAVLLLICAGVCFVVSNNIYESKKYDTIKIAYYLPDDADKNYNNLGATMLQNTESIKATAEIIPVDSIEEGKELLVNGEIMYFIVVPENFFTGIMEGTNPRIQVIVKDNASVEAYISNELFFAYASYLGVAQAGVYSALDTMYNHDYPDELFYSINDRVNIIYLNRALAKDPYVEIADATEENGFTLIEHYMASATIICLFFISFIMIQQLYGYQPGLIHNLKLNGISNVHLFISKFIYMTIAIYLSFIPCHIIMSIIFKKYNILGFITIIPAILIIAAIVALICSICNNIFSANMVILFVTILVLYIGGGLIPSALLPASIQSISKILPGEYLLRIVANSLFI